MAVLVVKMLPRGAGVEAVPQNAEVRVEECVRADVRWNRLPPVDHR